MRHLRTIGSSGIVAVTVALGGCAHGPGATDPGGVARLPVPAERTVCGWEAHDPEAPAVRILADGSAEGASAGQAIAIVDAHPAAPYGAVQRALAPAANSLVRLKVVIDGRWLVPLTFPRPVHPHPPPAAQSWVSHVGRRKVTRSTEVPALRFAEIRLDGDGARVHVENAGPGGEDLPIGELAALLRATDPPAQVFALTATEQTSWSRVQRAAVAAACYDRKPGEEPHEVILD